MSPDPVQEPASSTDERLARMLAERQERASEVRSTLRHDGSSEAKDMLERLQALDFVDSIVGQVTDVPERLGDYRITGLLGRGGMGTVYEAWQESLERPVALKVLAPHLATDLTMRARFRTEARATAALHHENIVPIYGFGEEAGFAYFAMERVHGISLDKHIASAKARGAHALGPLEAARRFAGVADALAHAHRRRILHRDVKPGNLLVHPDGTLALADFGLSKMLNEQAMALTQGGGFLGTLHYTPPEQATGRPLTPASDLYALGVTIFETLTGRLPLEGRSPEAMLEALLHHRPHRLREFLPGAPRDLEAVLDKLLAKDPAERYPDGEELARDLLRVADGEPVRIRRQSLIRRWLRWSRKNRTQAVAGAVATLAVIASLVAWQAGRITRKNLDAARFTNLIADAMAQAQVEPGLAQGPPALLAVLSGTQVALPFHDAPLASAFLRALRDARAMAPDDARAEELAAAYGEDPVPEVTALLQEGRGAEARAALDRVIEREQQGFARRDDATWLRLYRLYLARATACLTASVANLEEARMDVVRASFVRPGATYPQLLLLALKLGTGTTPGAVLGELGAFLADRPDAKAAAGALLVAIAGTGRPAEAHMMEFNLPYADRRLLHDDGLRLLGGVAPPPAEEPWVGLEARLAEKARDAIAARENGQSPQYALAEGQSLLDRHVDPLSPLCSWSLTYRLIEGRSIESSRSDGRPLPPSWPLRAWRNFLDLEPPARMLRAVRDGLEELLALQPQDAPATLALRTRLALSLEESRSLELANAWVAAEFEQPQAHLARFRASVDRGQEVLAMEAAVSAIQKSVDRESVRARVLAVLERAAGQGAEPLRQTWSRLAAALQGGAR